MGLLIVKYKYGNYFNHSFNMCDLLSLNNWWKFFKPENICNKNSFQIVLL